MVSGLAIKMKDYAANMGSRFVVIEIGRAHV